MAMTKYGAKPTQTSKTAAGNPGFFVEPKKVETLKEKLEREKRNSRK
jgi:hypothetical protein